MIFALTFYLLMIKHAICDFALQGRLKGSGNENKLLSKKKNLHALDHAVGISDCVCNYTRHEYANTMDWYSQFCYHRLCFTFGH